MLCVYEDPFKCFLESENNSADGSSPNIPGAIITVSVIYQKVVKGVI